LAHYLGEPQERATVLASTFSASLELVRSGQERIPVLLDAAGRPLTRHIVHIDDVIQAIDRALGNENAIGRDYNIAAADAFEYRAAADYIAEQTGTPTIEIPNPQYHPFRIDISRARQEIGYSPENDFQRMVGRAIEFRSQATPPLT
ncbi:MAG: NAD-dependent epimerase/dehydratase family protein, partial [Novipirellula sp. JB048]